jgi:thiol-disulfide isomerase/thioredoxin
MFLTLFLISTFSHEVEITPDNVDTIVGGPRPSFIKFYDPHCQACQAAAEDFSAAAELIPSVVFGSLNCEADFPLCQSFNVTSYPTFLLFPTGETNPIPFMSERRWDHFCTFLTDNTEFKCRQPPEIILQVDPRRLEKLTEEKKCLLLTFYATWSKESTWWLFEVNPVARAFEAEQEIAFGMTNCEKYGELCQVYELTSNDFPAIMLFKGDDVINYSMQRSRKDLIEFMNRNCECDREMDGFLSQNAGLIPEADVIVSEFLSGSEKVEVMEKLKRIEGAAVYVKAMERLMVNGTKQIVKDVESMEMILAERKSSWQVLDNVKKRYNVFVKFIERERDEI